MIDGGATSDVDTIVTFETPIDLILSIKSMEFDNSNKCYSRLVGVACFPGYQYARRT